MSNSEVSPPLSPSSPEPTAASVGPRPSTSPNTATRSTARSGRSTGPGSFGRGRARGLTIELAELDIASGESVREGFENILDRAGRIDHLINNAGVGGNGAVEETSAKRYLDVMNIDLWRDSLYPGRAAGDA